MEHPIGSDDDTRPGSEGKDENPQGNAKEALQSQGHAPPEAHPQMGRPAGNVRPLAIVYNPAARGLRSDGDYQLPEEGHWIVHPPGSADAM